MVAQLKANSRANNDYSKPYTAMPEMRAAKGRYFRGDEVGVKPEPATATPVASTIAPVPVAASGTANAPAAAAEGAGSSRGQKIWWH